MDYKLHYEKLITRAKNRILQEYYEVHHIVPRCMGGSNERDNLVDLTPEEHFVAHQLLIKIFPGNHKLTYALVKMTGDNGKRNNKCYGWIKRKLGEAKSIENLGRAAWNKGKTYEELYGTEKALKMKMEKSNNLKGKKDSEETKKKKSDSAKGKKKSPRTVEHTENWRKANIGRKQSDEEKLKRSIANKGKKKPPRSKEHSEKIKLANKGKRKPPRTQEHIKNLVESRMKKKYNKTK